MEYKVFDVKVLREFADMVSATLYDYPIQGVEILDAYISEEEQRAMFVDDFEIPNQQKDEITVKFYLSKEEDFKAIFSEIMEKLDSLNKIQYIGSLSVATDDSVDEDWAHNWKKYYEPFMIGERILVRPVWEDVTAIDGIEPEFIIDIDPGLAFGSGTHETTYMCVSALDEYIKGDEFLIDVGCGSGILGIAAAKLGIDRGVLIDLDQSACSIARENVKTNKTESQLDVIHGNLVDEINDKADVVVANIFAEVIIGVTPDVSSIVKKDGLFITSGIIKEKEMDVVKALEASDFHVLEVKSRGGWVCIVARKA